MPNLPTLDGSTAVITGAGSGIGRALSLDLAARGCRLALSDVNRVGLEKTRAMAAEKGAVEVLTAVVDVRDRDAMLAHAAEVAEALGDVHLVVNNAGVALHAGVLEQSRDDLEFIMDVDFWGVVNGTEAFLPALIASGRGRLVNISSLFGLVAMPGQSAYNAAKFAVRGYTEALAMEMAIDDKPVTVTCVHPGGIRTGIAKAARVAPGRDAEVLADLFDRKLARMSPERAAQIILRAAERGRPRVTVGLDAMAIHGLQRVLGSGYQRIVGSVGKRLLPDVVGQMSAAATAKVATVASDAKAAR